MINLKAEPKKLSRAGKCRICGQRLPEGSVTIRTALKSYNIPYEVTLCAECATREVQSEISRYHELENKVAGLTDQRRDRHVMGYVDECRELWTERNEYPSRCKICEEKIPAGSWVLRGYTTALGWRHIITLHAHCALKDIEQEISYRKQFINMINEAQK